MSTAVLIGLFVFSVALLLALVIVVRLNAFVALLLTSLVLAIVSGVPVAEIAGRIQHQMGSTLGYIAIVIGLGAMFGEMLRHSGGVSIIADRLLATFGERHAGQALALTGLIVATPVFFDVALILLIPLVYSLALRSGQSLLRYAVPLLAGIAVAHSFIPPTPGPVAVAGLLGADLGWVILMGLAAGLPAILVGGLWYGRWIAGRIHLDVPAAMIPAPAATDPSRPTRMPGFALSVSLIALPLVLILLGTVSSVLLPEGDRLREVLAFIGHPFVALIATVLLAFWTLGTRLGYPAAVVRDIATKSLEPVGMIILVTGAGGVFGQVLVGTGIGVAAADWMADSQLSIIVMAFLIATVVRVAQGSATVAMITAAGLIAPIIEAAEIPAPMVALVVIAIASGATMLSHVNDSGFWLVCRFLNMSEKQTLKAWTVMMTLVGLTGFAVALTLSAIF